MGKPIFIIEHLEPRVFRWCIIEYKHISSIVGKQHIWFTNIRRGSKVLEKFGKVIKKSVRDLGLQNACVLDPDADKTLIPSEAGKFDYFIFGGILGDYPPKQRTKVELTPFIKNAAVRNIGKEQLSTDNAVFVVNEIIKGRKLEDIKFEDKIEIKIKETESVGLPFRYPILNGKPNISPELITYLKRKKGF